MTAVRLYCLQVAFIIHPFDCWALASGVLYSTCSSPKPCRDSKPQWKPFYFGLICVFICCAYWEICLRMTAGLDLNKKRRSRVKSRLSGEARFPCLFSKINFKKVRVPRCRTDMVDTKRDKKREIKAKKFGSR